MDQNSNTTCPNAKDIIIMGTNPIERKAVFFNPACKQWDCPYCGELNKQYWVYQAQRGTQILLSEGNMLQFVTLTGRGYFTPTSSIVYFRQNWPKLRKRIQYLTDKWSDVTQTTFAYFLIPERHKSGNLHAHMLVTTFIDRDRWYKDNAHETGFGYQAKVKTIEDSSSAVSYVTKYIGKDFGGMSWPKGFMRVRHSQNWPMAEEKPLELWEWKSIGERDFWLEKGALENMGWFIIDKVGNVG